MYKTTLIKIGQVGRLVKVELYLESIGYTALRSPELIFFRKNLQHF